MAPPSSRHHRLFAELVAIAVGAVLVGLGGWFLLNLKCDTDAFFCDNDAPAVHPSPSGNRKFVLYLRSCGATTGYVTHGSILAADEPLPDAGGNVFGAIGAHYPPLSRDGGAPELVVTWLGDNELRVELTVHMTVLESKTTFEGVTIRYVRPPREKTNPRPERL